MAKRTIAQLWATQRPSALYISDLVKGSGVSLSRFSEYAGISIDRIKRLMGQKKGNSRGAAATPISWPEWLAIRAACEEIAGATGRRAGRDNPAKQGEKA